MVNFYSVLNAYILLNYQYFTLFRQINSAPILQQARKIISVSRISEDIHDHINAPVKYSSLF